MKIRLGFVSNSSSSSFIIPLKYVNCIQLEAIKDHIEVAKRLYPEMEYFDEAWEIKVDEETVSGSTSMDNFDMHDFLNKIGIPEDKIEWSDEDKSW